MKKLSFLLAAFAVCCLDKPEAVKPAAFNGARIRQGTVFVEVPAKSIIVLSEVGR